MSDSKSARSTSYQKDQTRPKEPRYKVKREIEIERVSKVRLTITDQIDGSKFTHCMEKTESFREAIILYCREKNITISSRRFFHDGIRMLAENTPKEFEMTDHEDIDVFSGQASGL